MTARLVAGLAGLFGLMTVAAGTRVLGGADPGYVVFRPLLIFNTIMGAVYLLAAIAIWRNAVRGGIWARSIALVNLAVLLTISVLHLGGAPVAIQSLAAMTARTLVWGLAVLALRSRGSNHAAG